MVMFWQVISLPSTGFAVPRILAVGAGPSKHLSARRVGRLHLRLGGQTCMPRWPVLPCGRQLEALRQQRFHHDHHRIEIDRRTVRPAIDYRGGWRLGDDSQCSSSSHLGASTSMSSLMFHICSIINFKVAFSISMRHPSGSISRSSAAWTVLVARFDVGHFEFRGRCRSRQACCLLPAG